MMLERIIADRKRTVGALKKSWPLDLAAVDRTRLNPCRDLKAAISSAPGLGIIAEVKQASPSKGIICQDFDPSAIAKEYAANKAAGISVLTEPKYFLGKDEYLTEIGAVVSLPILRKDFIIDPYQILEAKLLGADCILLIAAVLSLGELVDFIKLAKELKLQCLVEVHNQTELDMALEAGADFVGINNRNLHTFETNLEVTLELASFIPKDIVVISESGVHTCSDMELLEAAGVDGVLIGESLMRAADISQKFRELRGELDEYEQG